MAELVPSICEEADTANFISVCLVSKDKYRSLQIEANKNAIIVRGVLKWSSDRPDQPRIGKDELIQKSARPSDEYHFPPKIPRINIIIMSLQ